MSVTLMIIAPPAASKDPFPTFAEALDYLRAVTGPRKACIVEGGFERQFVRGPDGWEQVGWHSKELQRGGLGPVPGVTEAEYDRWMMWLEIALHGALHAETADQWERASMLSRRANVIQR